MLVRVFTARNHIGIPGYSLGSNLLTEPNPALRAESIDAQDPSFLEETLDLMARVSLDRVRICSVCLESHANFARPGPDSGSATDKLSKGPATLNSAFSQVPGPAM